MPPMSEQLEEAIMSVLDQIRDLDRQKEALLAQAKEQAIQKAESAVAELNELGFNYRLVEGAGSTGGRSTGGRRSGVRDEVLNVIKQHPQGIARADILEEMHAKGDKKAEQSISNALANMKKAGLVTADDGQYKAA